MKTSKRERKVSEKTREIIDRRKSALLELSKGEKESASHPPTNDGSEENIKDATEKVFDRWNKVFTELAKRNEADK